jgi:hypothetical protein
MQEQHFPVTVNVSIPNQYCALVRTYEPGEFPGVIIPMVGDSPLLANIVYVDVLKRYIAGDHIRLITVVPDDFGDANDLALLAELLEENGFR